MTRRDYVRLAAALREARITTDTAAYDQSLGGSARESAAYSMGQRVAWERAVNRVADAIAADNPRFDRDRFWDAADR